MKLFLSAPMSASSETEFQDFRAWAANLVLEVKHRFEGTVFSASSLIVSLNNTEDAISSVIKDFAELDRSDGFVMLYPRKVATSALIELGYALAKGKSILIVTPNYDCLPFMAQKLHLANDRTTTVLVEPLSSAGAEAVFAWIEASEGFE